jgi:hypothetical protein
MTTANGESTPPPELCNALRAAADRLLSGTPLRSGGKLTILDLAQEAGIKRWLLTHKYRHQLKEKYQAEFAAVGSKSKPVKAAHDEIEQLRSELCDARTKTRDATELARAYALIIDQLAENLADVTAERDALKKAEPQRIERPARVGLHVSRQA